MSGRARPAAALAGAVLIIAAGLWASFRYAHAAWPFDADAAVPLSLWDGVRRHGLGFIASWAHTQDNWLLTHVPFCALLFELFGPRQGLAAAMGWLVFVGGVAMTGLLAALLAGWRAGLALACVLISASYWALGPVGYLAHPLSHNVSAAWAVLALLLALWGVQRARRAPCVLAALIVFADTLSDPWAGAALAIPLIVASGAVALLHSRTPQSRRAALLCALSLIAFAGAYTRLFGALDFLTATHGGLARPAAIPANLYWAYRTAGAAYNIVPLASLDARPVKIVSGLAFLAMIGWAMAASAFRLRRATPGRQLVCGASLLSILAVGAAFLLGEWEPGLTVGRFFPNLYFLGGLLVATAAADRWRSWSWPPRAAVAGYGALLVVCGLTSLPAVLVRPAQHPKLEATRALTGFLQAQGLGYGYGPYWGTQALIVPWLTDGRVLIRPVSFRDGTVRRRPAETSSYWFRPQDEPAGLGRRFLVIQDDGEECPSVAACEAIAVRQFGPPSERLTYLASVILVWPEPIVERIDP